MDSDNSTRPLPDDDDISALLVRANLTELPSFVTAEQFLEVIAQQRDRDIQLRELAELPPSLCGVWMALPDHDLIIINSAVTGARRDLVIFHEAAHVLLDHHGTGPVTTDEDNAVPATEAEHLLLRSLSGDGVTAEQITSMLFRSHFDDRQEWDAEWLATYFLARTRGTARSAWVSRRGTQYAAKVLYGDN